jgi:hypothetical protein
MRALTNITIFIFLFTGICTSCFQSKNNQITEQSSINLTCNEEDILNSIYKLENVKELDSMLEKHHYSSMCIITKDSNQNPVRYFYVVQVGHDNGLRFVIDQNYYYYCDTEEIFYLETLTDSLIKVN